MNDKNHWRRVQIYSIAHAAGTDAANKRMKSQKRTVWNRQDWNEACRVTGRLLDEMGWRKEP